MVTPVPALILTLSPGLIKPTVLSLACNVQPLLLIALATALSVVKPVGVVILLAAPVVN